MDGIIPFVFGAIKKRRGARSMTEEYERLHSGAEAERFPGGGPYRSESCRFEVARPPPADELDPWRDDHALPERSRDERYQRARDGRGVSRSREFGSMRLFACIGDP
jgi:hypothetical protein